MVPWVSIEKKDEIGITFCSDEIEFVGECDTLGIYREKNTN